MNNPHLHFHMADRLEAVVTMMRRLGVIQYKDKDVEVVLGPEPEESEKTLDSQPLNTPSTSGKLGKDGLDAAGQLARYGHVVDAE